MNWWFGRFLVLRSFRYGRVPCLPSVVHISFFFVGSGRIFAGLGRAKWIPGVVVVLILFLFFGLRPYFHASPFMDMT